jgi:hypothetical protein
MARACANPLRLGKWCQNWDDLAIGLFERTRRRGGLFQLWGHSWEIAQQGDWARLERVLRHISGQEGVRYVTNGDLIALGAQPGKGDAKSGP